MTTIPPFMPEGFAATRWFGRTCMARGLVFDPESPGFRRGLLVAPGFAPRRRSG